MDKANLSLEFTNDLAELENLKQYIEKFGKENSIDRKKILDLNLVIDEVFTNIVSYGFTDNEKHLIKIDIRIINRELIARVEDDGVPFDPTIVPETNLFGPVENRKIGGIGLHLINKKMSSVVYKRKKNKNILVLKKCLYNKKI
jgi:serine/threonine-protein kinase RsbW